ncbi:MAG TPA: hypothetical protein VEK78_14890 [Gemmatimonadales bacterium]|nr:hypothetical protein [Gemmatimonadales bacterium]
MTTILRKFSLVGFAALFAACAGSPALKDRVTLLPTPGDRILGERLIDAHYVVAGTLLHVERATLYEPLGGWLMRALLQEDGPPEAYEAKIQVDSVLKGGGQPKRLYVVFFAPHGNQLPAVGMSAIWIAHRRQLWRLAQSSHYGTPSDVGLALDSDDDIRPLDEWSQLRAVAQRLQLSHLW